MKLPKKIIYFILPFFLVSLPTDLLLSIFNLIAKISFWYHFQTPSRQKKTTIHWVLQQLTQSTWGHCRYWEHPFHTQGNPLTRWDTVPSTGRGSCGGGGFWLCGWGSCGAGGAAAAGWGRLCPPKKPFPAQNRRRQEAECTGNWIYL